jgi:hypothetical protein
MLRPLAAAALAFVVAGAAPASAPSVPWTDLGGGLAGSLGTPSLQGTGALSPGTPGSLEISNTPPFAGALLFFSLVEVDVPFKGGTLQAYPPIAEYFFPLGPTGLSFPWTSWPSALPAGVEMYFQIAVKDLTAPKGVALSNLLLGITQP